MIKKVKEHIKIVNDFKSKNIKEIENFRILYNGKKGILADFFKSFKEIPEKEKKQFGKIINELKNLVNLKLNSLLEDLSQSNNSSKIYGDLYRSGFPYEIGSEHPISIVTKKILNIFSRIGFVISEGPEIEDDWHNFSALNLPAYHPARDMQDTFFIETDPDILLRTHTSSVQVRYMETNEPPIRTISPGRVYRNEAISSRSHCIFHQIEGLFIDKNVSFADLKKTLMYFTESLFRNSKIRLRPSYFPFTEPSAEVDIYWGLETEIDHKITKGTGWLEIMGCGMVDPNVLENCNIDSNEYSGYAFGMGIERIAMLLYQIGDIRMFFENDLRLLEQFKS
ncbi:MAG: phenylalanine--tRNA ligase subunit alpha [Flavobacteriaceae bacterium]|nr:phenylalanine--tRNA ligase subunit alpha [Flavobacteriaceae bacterium]